MGAEKPQSAEAFALERIAAAAREVQAASTALQTHFAGERHDEGRHTSALDNPTVDHSRQGLTDIESVTTGRLAANIVKAWIAISNVERLTDLLRGQAWLVAGEAAKAKKALDRQLASHPECARAWLLRARAAQRMGEDAASLADYREALSRTASPEQRFRRRRHSRSQAPRFPSLHGSRQRRQVGTYPYRSPGWNCQESCGVYRPLASTQP